MASTVLKGPTPARPMMDRLRLRFSLSLVALLATAVAPCLAGCSGDSGQESDGADDPAASGASGSSGTSGGSSGRRSGSARASTCAEPPKGIVVGTEKGAVAPDYLVRDCDDNDVHLADFCEGDATWLYEVHTWCPHTQAVSEFAESLHHKNKSRKLMTVHVLVENEDRQPPTARDCKEWKARYGLKDVVVLYDASQASKALNDSTFTSLSVFLDKQRIIRGKSHADAQDLIQKGIDGAFTPAASQ